MKKKASAYARAGVNIDAKMSAISAVKKMIRSTQIPARASAPGVIGGVGSFGGMFSSPGRDKILIASTDGVGTKLKVASIAGRYKTVGEDIVNHCVNDILVHGAEPLFFLDYFGTAKFNGPVFQAALAGLCKACRENGCALIAGETAEMPGVYIDGQYDLVGTIVGVVGKKDLIDGETIRPGDALIGLPSTGLHTNGYSLARKIIFEKAGLGVDDILPGTGRSVADVLLAVHKSYLKPVRALLKKIRVRGMAHITGGGFQDNVPRVLPCGVDAVIERSAWTVPPLFRFLQERGEVDQGEMYRVFNMGIGLVIIVRDADVSSSLSVLKAARAKPKIIGHVEKGSGVTRLIG